MRDSLAGCRLPKLENCNSPRTTCNVQHTTHNMQHTATYSVTYRIKHMQRATYPMRFTTYNALPSVSTARCMLHVYTVQCVRHGAAASERIGLSAALRKLLAENSIALPREVSLSALPSGGSCCLRVAFTALACPPTPPFPRPLRPPYAAAPYWLASLLPSIASHCTRTHILARCGPWVARRAAV